MGAVSRGDVSGSMPSVFNQFVEGVKEAASDSSIARYENAVSMKEALTDPTTIGDAAQANKVPFKKSIEKTKEPKKVKPGEAVLRKEAPKGLDKELDQHAQNFVEKFQTMKKSSLLGLRKEIEDLGKEPTSAQILKTVTTSYSKGHEAEAYHAFNFLLETTTGDLNGVIKEAKEDFEKQNKVGIDKGLSLENIAKSVEGSVDDFKGKEGKIQNLNEKFIDLVAMEADTNLLDEHLLSKVSHEEASKILEFFTSAAGDKMRKTEVGPEMHALWQSLQAIQGYRGVQNQINKANPAQHYERALAKHIEHMGAAAA